ncbi:MAG: GlmU family protein [Bacteroidia bacterium]|nr:GlmU family protein [Bacteroidia bacterium]
MNFILFDDTFRDDLLPLAFTRPVADIRIGILTIREKWEKMLGKKTSTQTQDYLSVKYPVEFTIDEDNIWLNGSICPNAKLIEEINQLKPLQALYSGDVLIALNSGSTNEISLKENVSFVKKFESHASALKLNNLWDIFVHNGKALSDDFELITHGRNSITLSQSNRIIGVENIFVEEGARVECAILNASTGPIYIGKEAEIMEGTMVRGPFALCENSTLKLGTKIYGPTTVGPHSKVGGEVNNSVIFAYSNKAHDGFLGNSVIGEWCNIGADSNNSNLKNNYAEVDLWNYKLKDVTNTGLIFCGLIMGDHSKCGINTMFNTGTVVGVNANIFGAGFPHNFIPDFSWGGHEDSITYKLDAALHVAAKVMERRGIALTEADKEILKHIFEITTSFRS